MAIDVHIGKLSVHLKPSDPQRGEVSVARPVTEAQWVAIRAILDGKPTLGGAGSAGNAGSESGQPHSRTGSGGRVATNVRLSGGCASAAPVQGQCGVCFNTGATVASSENGIAWCNCPIGQQRKQAAAGAAQM